MELYDKHKLVHDLQRQYVCLLCKSVFAIAKGLEGHLKNHQEFKQEVEEEESSNPYGSGLPDDEYPIVSQYIRDVKQESCDLDGNS